MDKQNTEKKRDRVGMTLYGAYLALLVISVVIIVKIIGIQMFFTPDPRMEEVLTPKNSHIVTEPTRGTILDCKGRILAMSYPVYRLHVDCTVGDDDKWKADVKKLCASLPSYLPGKSSDQYLKMFLNGRNSKQKYMELGEPVDLNTLNEIKRLPLFKRGKYGGGLIVEQENTRRYPYGTTARRTIGFVRSNKAGVSNNHVGIEGRYDYLLHGRDGSEWLRVTDKGEKVRNTDSVQVKAMDGQDITLTLDIDIQTAADKALRSHIENENLAESACLVLMEVQTGAIRAMVNLTRNPANGKFEEISNVAIGHKHEPGSVFKTVTLLSVLSDGGIRSLDETIPTNHGKVEGSQMTPDRHIVDFEREHNCTRISILDGFKMSSNYVFATLAIKNYGNNPKHFIERIYSYKLGEAFDFDLQGLQTPDVPLPFDGKRTNLTELGSIGFGYNTGETPLHILNFYNAIAAGGKMSKPYLVGKPSILNATICSKAVADTVTRALRAVTEEGTARKLKNSKISIAGKTGTSFGTFPKEERGASAYFDKEGRQKYQGTFVGFFPVESPRYSVICSLYSKPTRTNYNFQGGGIPALVIKDLLDYLYRNEPYWRENL